MKEKKSVLLIYLKVLVFMFIFLVGSCSEDFVKNSTLRKELKTKVVKGAMSHLGEVYIDFKGRKYDFDCSGFVRFVFIEYMGIDIDRYVVRPNRSKVETYYESFRIEVKGKFKVTPGDLVFFDNTYDKNRNGVMDDKLTHIGMVIGYDKDTGSIVFINKSKGKPVSLGYLNFQYPDRDFIVKEGRSFQVNSYVRDDKVGKLLSTQAFRGFGRIPFISNSLGDVFE